MRGTARAAPCHRAPIATLGVRAARDGVDRDDGQGWRLDHDGTAACSKDALAHTRPCGHPPLQRPTRLPMPSLGQRAPAAWGAAAAVPWSVATSAADVGPLLAPAGGAEQDLEEGGVEGPVQGQRRQLPQGRTEQGCVTCHVTTCHVTTCHVPRHVPRATPHATTLDYGPDPDSGPDPRPPTLALTPDLAGTQFLVFESHGLQLVLWPPWHQAL